MDLFNHIQQIKTNIEAERFNSEAEVSQGIVLRLLQALGWQIYDSEIVCPEYSVEGRRVDFALCHPRSKPIVFIEVKQIGQSEGAEKQLFEYAFHHGVPMAILTDGQEWQFFLPAEQGEYQDRRVYKLDLLEREIEESVEIFVKYLEYNAISSGKAIDTARKDYQNVARKRQILDTLPIAWSKLIDEKDELLIELIADKVESLCGYKPEFNAVSSFLLKQDFIIEPSVKPTISQPQRKRTQNIKLNTHKITEEFSFVLKGKTYNAKNARDVMEKVFKTLDRSDKTFLKRFNEQKHGKKRRYIARDKYKLYPDRPDLCEQNSVQLRAGWYMGTNYSRDNIIRILKLACDVAGLRYGKDLVVNM